MAIPNPNPNIADGIKSDNKTYSSNKIESLIKTATELPIPEEGDAGKVLTVNADADGYELDTIPAEVPTPGTGDEGKVIAVNSGEDGYELIDLPTYPTFTKKNYTAALTSNEGVTPYASYALIQIGADIEAYGPVAAVVINSTVYDQIITYGLNPANGDLRVYGTKTGDVTVTVIYADINTAT